jgi:hypothetical protein
MESSNEPAVKVASYARRLTVPPCPNELLVCTARAALIGACLLSKEELFGADLKDFNCRKTMTALSRQCLPARPPREGAEI